MDRYYPVALTVPGFTAPATPVAQNVLLEDIILVDIEVIIPTGHMNTTGVRVLQSGQQILPWGNLSWLTGDGYSRVFDVNEEIGANSISVQAYDNDFFAHTFYLRFHVRDSTTATMTPLSSDLQAASGLAGLSSALHL